MIEQMRIPIPNIRAREKIYWVTISSSSREDMIKLAKDYSIDIFRHTLKIEGERYSVDGFASASEIQRLRDDNYQVEIIRDLEEIAREVQDWVASEEEEPTV